MARILFCNIGFMKQYQGRVGQFDKLRNGGRWVQENETGGETCNFIRCPDGFVYGHVESIRDKKDTEIDLGRLGASNEDISIDGVDVVWTATPRLGDGRRVVGWYRTATVFRRRQYFEIFRPRPKLTSQHRRDELESFRIRTAVGNEFCLPLEERTLRLGHGKGWFGETQWWFADNSSAEVRKFLREVRQLMENRGPDTALERRPNGHGSKGGSGGNALSPQDAYHRYVASYEAVVLPRHRELQDAYRNFCLMRGFIDAIPEPKVPVDLCFRDKKGRLTFVEVKPCDAKTVRFAIRTAMGQLLDYGHVCRPRHKVIVIDARPDAEALDLAISHGFGIAYPAARAGNAFEVIMPNEHGQAA